MALEITIKTDTLCYQDKPPILDILIGGKQKFSIEMAEGNGSYGFSFRLPNVMTSIAFSFNPDSGRVHDCLMINGVYINGVYLPKVSPWLEQGELSMIWDVSSGKTNIFNNSGLCCDFVDNIRSIQPPRRKPITFTPEVLSYIVRGQA